MAHKRSSKKTSFGKKSAPEKAFLKKGRKSGKEDFEKRPKRSFGKPPGSFSSKPGTSGSDRLGRKNSGSSKDEGMSKRTFDRSEFTKRKKTGFESGDKFDRKDSRRSSEPSKAPFVKRSGYSKRTDKSFSKEKERRAEAKEFYSSKSLGFTKKGKSSTEKNPTVAMPEYEPRKDEMLTRLNKHIANSGMGSRREADEMIKKGLISVNGVTITEMGFKVKPGDVVRYEDRVLKAEKPVYVLLNKPKGFITTTADPQERKTVMNLVASACKERLYPVGRLDRNTTGLLLLTNDGDLAAKLTHPSYNTKKIYKVELDRPLSKNDFQKIQDGIHLEEGKAIVDDLAFASDDKKTIGIEIHIGWNRVIRRIFESLEYEVVKLDRVLFAGLDKKDLPRGEWRFLKPEEVVRLKHFK